MTRKTIVIIGIVAVLGIVFVSHALRRHYAEAQLEKEQTLRSNLSAIRGALKSYEEKHHSKAHTLADVVRSGELATIPVDPITKSASTWRLTVEENVRVDDFNATATAASAPSVIDVRSGAPGLDSSGRPWSDY
jgi:general secretion pathway protein G